MVINRTRKYCFIQIPHTASTAIARELCENYGGEHILHKHATWADFSRAMGTREAGKYFVFAGIRNPMDMVTTKYHKRNADHGGMFTEKSAELRSTRRGRKHLKEFHFVRDHPGNFQAYFENYYRKPYNDLAGGLPSGLDFIVRHETIQESFSALMKELAFEQVRELPRVNRTEKSAPDLIGELTGETAARLPFVFGPYMERWGYSFPAEWNRHASPTFGQFLYHCDCLARRFYYKRLACGIEAGTCFSKPAS